MSLISLDTTTVLYMLVGTVLVLTLLVIHLEIRVKRLLKGKDGKSLEASIHTIIKSQKDLEEFRKELEEYLARVEKRVKRSMQGTATIRFNPFKGSSEGGNQSFATALINENGDGVVMSSLYARDRVSMFSKPLQKYASEHTLSDEEQEALDKARQALDTEK